MQVSSAQITQIAKNTGTKVKTAKLGKVIDESLANNMRVVVPMAVAGLIGYDTYTEYKNASKKDKKNVLMGNSLLLVGAIAGGKAGFHSAKNFLDSKQAEKIANNKKVKSFISKIPYKLKQFPYRDYIENLSVPAGAIFSNIFVGQLSEKAFPVNRKPPEQVIDKAGIFAELDYGTLGKAYNYSYSGLGVADSVDNTFSTMAGFSVGKEKGLKNKIKRGLFELVSGVMVPLTMILPFTKVLNKKIPSKSARAAITLGLGVGSCFTGKTIAREINKKVTENVLEHKMWMQLSQKQSELMQYSLKNMQTMSSESRQEVLRQMNNLRELKKTMKQPDFHIHEFINSSIKASKLDNKKDDNLQSCQNK